MCKLMSYRGCISKLCVMHVCINVPLVLNCYESFSKVLLNK